MINLSGKRLLFMGATDMMKSAVILAKSMGITTIVVDYNEKSPAKAFADKSYLVSTANIDEILKICKKEGIDGVFFGYSELNQYYTLDICTKLNLPFYADKNQINILANKKNFKNRNTRERKFFYSFKKKMERSIKETIDKYLSNKLYRMFTSL